MTLSASASLALAPFVGMASGLHTATWGMYKDAMYEGFSRRTFARSIVVGMVAATAAQLVMRFDLGTPAGFLMLFGLAYVLERAAVEFHKTFLRDEDQSKYFIPPAFAVRGRVVTSRRRRAAIGALVAAVVGLVVGGLALAGSAGPLAHPVLALAVMGSAGGWISACGGAWKDAPKEGFETFKFFRSPAISFVYALLLASFTTSWIVIAFGALGFTIATIETHKMFDRSHTRGKFTGKPVRYPETLLFRRRFVPVFLAIWAVVLVNLVAALRAGQGGFLASFDLAGLL